jgi:hypothetical protein
LESVGGAKVAKNMQKTAVPAGRRHPIAGIRAKFIKI